MFTNHHCLPSHTKYSFGSSPQHQEPSPTSLLLVSWGAAPPKHHPPLSPAATAWRVPELTLKRATRRSPVLPESLSATPTSLPKLFIQSRICFLLDLASHERSGLNTLSMKACSSLPLFTITSTNSTYQQLRKAISTTLDSVLRRQELCFFIFISPKVHTVDVPLIVLRSINVYRTEMRSNQLLQIFYTQPDLQYSFRTKGYQWDLLTTLV